MFSPKRYIWETFCNFWYFSSFLFAHGGRFFFFFCSALICVGGAVVLLNNLSVLLKEKRKKKGGARFYLFLNFNFHKESSIWSAILFKRFLCTMVRADMSSHPIRRTLWASIQLAVVFDLSWFIISTRFFNKKLVFTLSILTSIWYLYFSYITKPCPLVPFHLNKTFEY